MSNDDISPEEFARAFRRIIEWAAIEDRAGRSPFKTMLNEHFGADAATFPVTGDSIAPYDLPNLQLALAAHLGRDAVEHRLVGFGGPVGYAEMSLSGLVHDLGLGIAVGPVRRTVVQLDGDRSVTCITAGLFLVREGEHSPRGAGRRTGADGQITRTMLGGDGGAALTGLRDDDLEDDEEWDG